MPKHDKQLSPEMEAMCTKLSELAQAFNRDVDVAAGDRTEGARAMVAASQVGHAISLARNPEQTLHTIMSVLIEASRQRGVSFSIETVDWSGSGALH